MSNRCKSCLKDLKQPINTAYPRKFCDKKCYHTHLQKKLKSSSQDTLGWNALKIATNVMMGLYTVLMAVALYVNPSTWGAIGFYVFSLVLFGVYVHLRDI